MDRTWEGKMPVREKNAVDETDDDDDAVDDDYDRLIRFEINICGTKY